MKVLVYSFERFHNLKSNPSYEVGKEIVKRFDPQSVRLIRLPVTYNCWGILRKEIDRFNPEFVLGLGVAMRISKVKVEKIALNYKYAGIPDNEGTRPECEKISCREGLALETEIDVLNLVNRLKEDGIPAEISFHAGTYVCNCLYFNCLRYLQDKKIKTLFIHVPASPEEVIGSNMDLASFPTYLIARGISLILSEAQF